MPWRDIPPRWWAVLVGVAFGSLALISIDGPKKGYGKATIAGLLTAPVLAVIAGGLLPDGTSVEIAALVGGVVALGGTGVIMAAISIAPELVRGGLTGVANSYLNASRNPPPSPSPSESGSVLHRTGASHPEEPDTRYLIDGTPATPDPEAERLLREIDPKDE